MQGAGDRFAEDDALRQRSAFVRTFIFQREYRIDCCAKNRDDFAVAAMVATRTEWRNVVEFADGDKGHGVDIARVEKKVFPQMNTDEHR